MIDRGKERSSGVLGGRVAFAHAAGRRARPCLGGVVPLLLVAAASGGCGSPAAFEIERTVGGSRRLGAFVAPSSYEHFIRGELHRGRGAWLAAEGEYEQARAGVADDPLLVARVADVRDRRGDEAGARAALDEGFRLAPESQIIWQTRGELAERHGDLPAAAAGYERASALSDDDEEPLLALARVLHAMGRDAAAEAALTAWIDRRPRSVGALRARLSLFLSAGRSSDAADAALALVRSSPGHAQEVEEAARAALDAGRPTLAHRLLAALPTGSVSASLRLEVALAAGLRPEVEASLASFDPEGADALMLAARCALWLDDPARAVELAGLARASGHVAEATMMLARARLAEGRLEEAASLAGSVSGDSSALVQARALVAEALAARGFPGLAGEVTPR